MPELGGGFAKIRRILGTFQKEGVERVGKALAQEAIAQSMACFRLSRDPYGEPWAPLRSRNGKPLLKTGRGRASITVKEISGTSFRIGTNVRYMAAHQSGVNTTYTRAPSSRFQAMANGRFLSRKAAGKKRQGSLYNATRIVGLHYKGGEVHLVIPQRAFLPLRGRLGPIWAPAFERVALAVARKIQRGGS